MKVNETPVVSREPTPERITVEIENTDELVALRWALHAATSNGVLGDHFRSSFPFAGEEIDVEAQIEGMTKLARELADELNGLGQPDSRTSWEW
jgi:hypothetical protein